MKKLTKKLNLSLESVKTLSAAQLSDVAGGATTYCPTGFTCAVSGCVTLTCNANCTPTHNCFDSVWICG